MIVEQSELKRKHNAVFLGQSLPNLLGAAAMATRGYNVALIPTAAEVQSGLSWEDRVRLQCAVPTVGLNLPHFKRLVTEGNATDLGLGFTASWVPEKSAAIATFPLDKKSITWSADGMSNLAELANAFPNDIRKIQRLMLALEDICCEYVAAGHRCADDGVPSIRKAFEKTGAWAKLMTIVTEPFQDFVTGYLKSRKFMAWLDTFLVASVGRVAAECPVLVGALALAGPQSVGMIRLEQSPDEVAARLLETLSAPSVSVVSEVEVRVLVVDDKRCTGVGFEDGRHIRGDAVVLDVAGDAEMQQILLNADARAILGPWVAEAQRRERKLTAKNVSEKVITKTDDGLIIVTPMEESAVAEQIFMTQPSVDEAEHREGVLTTSHPIRSLDTLRGDVKHDRLVSGAPVACGIENLLLTDGTPGLLRAMPSHMIAATAQVELAFTEPLSTSKSKSNVSWFSPSALLSGIMDGLAEKKSVSST